MSGSNTLTVSHEAPASVPGRERPQPEAERKRIRTRIYVQLLLMCDKSSVRKTRLVYTLNLNFNTIRGYTKLLIEKGLLLFDDPWYWTTEEGSRWAREISPLLAEVGE